MDASRPRTMRKLFCSEDFHSVTAVYWIITKYGIDPNVSLLTKKKEADLLQTLGSMHPKQKVVLNH